MPSIQKIMVRFQRSDNIPIATQLHYVTLKAAFSGKPCKQHVTQNKAKIDQLTCFAAGSVRCSVLIFSTKSALNGYSMSLGWWYAFSGFRSMTSDFKNVDQSWGSFQFIDVSCIYTTAMFSFLVLLGVTKALKDYQIDFYDDFKWTPPALPC